jgi:hypothetical protein
MKTTTTHLEAAPPSLRAVLAHSYVAAVAILVMLVWSLDWMVRAVVASSGHLIEYLATMAAIRGLPSIDFSDRIALSVGAFYVLSALCIALGAWLLSRWVYGAGPLRSLQQQRLRFAGRPHV